MDGAHGKDPEEQEAQEQAGQRIKGLWQPRRIAQDLTFSPPHPRPAWGRLLRLVLRCEGVTVGHQPLVPVFAQKYNLYL